MRILCVSRVTIHFALTVLLFLAIYNSGISAAPETVLSRSEIVELPTLSITDTRELPPPEKWRYTRITDFEVISSASDRESRKLLRDFEIFRMALSIAWPMQLRQPPPSTIILCGRGQQFASFLPPQELATSTSRASATLNNQEQAFIVLDLATKTITADPSAYIADIDTTGPIMFDVDHYKQLYREYVRYLFSQSQSRPPVWLEEGLSQIVMSMEFDKRTIIFGRIDSAQTISASQESANALNAAAAAAEDTTTPLASASVEDLDFNAVLKNRSLLPFDKFFGVTRDSETARNPLGNNVWAKQCYAFVHICLYRMDGRYKKPFEAFVARTAKEPATEAIFEECFGKAYKKFLGDLRGYINFTDYKYQQFNIKGKETLDTPPPEMRDATEGESARIKGDAFRIAGKATAARDTLVAAYIRGERDLPFLATLGQVELAAGNTERARKFLEASSPKTTRSSVLSDLARLRLDEAKASPASVNKKLSDAQLSAVLKPLFTARTFPTARPEVYELIAAAWLAAETAPKPEHFSALTEGLKLFPRYPGLIYNTAALYAHVGNRTAARALTEHGEKMATEDIDRTRFIQLRESLPPLPAAPPAPSMEPDGANR